MGFRVCHRCLRLHESDYQPGDHVSWYFGKLLPDLRSEWLVVVERLYSLEAPLYFLRDFEGDTRKLFACYFRQTPSQELANSVNRGERGA